MTNATIDLVYAEIKQVRKELEEIREMHGEVHALKYALVPEEETTQEELEEIKKGVQEMKQGKAIPWRKAFKVNSKLFT